MRHNGLEPSSYNLGFIEELYDHYAHDPQSVPSDWRTYFDGLAPGAGGTAPRSEASTAVLPTDCCHGLQFSLERCRICGRHERVAELQHRVDRLIRNYRVRGHRIARIDPLGFPRFHPPELEPSYSGLSDEHMDFEFFATTMAGGQPIKLREIIERLQSTYCRSIGVQYMHIDDMQVRGWLQERMEPTGNRLTLSREKQLRILTRLTDGVIFEQFIQKKYIGAKRFSLEGGETLIPLLDMAIEEAGAQGLNEIVLGMAHRGRLNMLANIMGKSAGEILREFEDAHAELYLGKGDVKYHKGYHSDWKTQSGRVVHLALCFNPSHLEFVNPVVLGRVRAKQDRLGDIRRNKGMAILIHGDAAFAGEGIVQETLNLSQLDGYAVGGALHIVINNQIGFTTPPEQGRSTVYASDAAKMLQIPIFHVNGEDPEAVAQVIKLAMDFRRTFKRDVVIDMYCYRRHGHNEGDEPTFTQPVLYKAIQERMSVRDSYLQHLLTLGGVTQEEADEIAERRQATLDAAFAQVRDQGTAQTGVKSSSPYHPSILGRVWKNYQGGPDTSVPDVDTGIDRDRAVALLEGLTRVPEGFHPHPKITRFIAQRIEMANGEQPLDWSAGEALAFASLVTDGVRIRLTGQDSIRGTFSHRHAAFYDTQTGEPYMPLANLAEDQGPVEIRNSPLSEAAVLGFEYGYSIAYPDGLVMWEAQFGDFANAAQVMIDQFIISAEDKWNSLTGLVMLLPHGFEGMGPEHSSARLERFMQLAAEDNIQVIYPTTSAQFFHALRRQVLRPWRKPLVVMTPKSMLRLPAAASPLEDFTTGTFQRIIPDTGSDPGAVERVLLCSGKIYYDLVKEREESQRDDVAILRVEQLYPLRQELLIDLLSVYRENTPVLWVQEEPENMGAWRFMRCLLGFAIAGRYPLYGVFRPASASPATGSGASHRYEQERLVRKAFDAYYAVPDAY